MDEAAIVDRLRYIRKDLKLFFGWNRIFAQASKVTVSTESLLLFS
jgi:hypothetical protein